MAIRVECVCGKKLSIKDELAGRRLKCPACDQTFTAPLAEPEGSRKSRPKDRGEENRPVQGATAKAGKSPTLRSRTNGQRAGTREKTLRKPSNSSKRGLLIGLSVAVGLVVLAAVAVMLRPSQPDVASSIVTQGSEVKNLADSDGVASTTSGDANTGSPPPLNSSGESPVAAMSGTSTSPSPAKNTSNSADDLKLLQGKWQITDFALDTNQPTPQVMRDEMTRTTWTIEGSSLLVSTPAGSTRATVVIDATQTPKWLDINKVDGPDAGKPGRAVYSLQEDSLKVCIGLDGSVRPKEIIADLAQAQIVFTLKKEQGTNSSGPAVPLPSGQFNFDAWTIASEKLKALNVQADLIRCDGPEFPEGLTYVCAVNPSVATDGSISSELWTAISSVSHVMLRLPSINDSTLHQVSQHPGLIGLVISGDSDLTPNGITPLKNCTNLRSLVFSGIPVTPELLTAVVQLSDLRFFAIGDCSVSGEMVASMVRLSKLKILSLQNAGVTDADMAVIANITTLERLLLDNAKLTDQGLAPLKKLSGLKILGVSGINITPQAFADFEAAVPGCRILK